LAPFRIRRQKIKRLAVRVEVGLAAGVIALTGLALLLAALISYLGSRMPFYQALSITAALLFLLAALALIGVKIWEASRAPATEPTLSETTSLTTAIRSASSGPMGVLSSALVSRQIRKAPVTTAVGLAAIGLLMATHERRRALKGLADKEKPAE
jgi:FtsH-binding integral membrane protein